MSAGPKRGADCAHSADGPRAAEGSMSDNVVSFQKKAKASSPAYDLSGHCGALTWQRWSRCWD